MTQQPGEGAPSTEESYVLPEVTPWNYKKIIVCLAIFIALFASVWIGSLILFNFLTEGWVSNTPQETIPIIPTPGDNAFDPSEIKVILICCSLIALVGIAKMWIRRNQ